MLLHENEQGSHSGPASRGPSSDSDQRAGLMSNGPDRNSNGPRMAGRFIARAAKKRCCCCCCCSRPLALGIPRILSSSLSEREVRGDTHAGGGARPRGGGEGGRLSLLKPLYSMGGGVSNNSLHGEAVVCEQFESHSVRKRNKTFKFQIEFLEHKTTEKGSISLILGVSR